MKVLTLLATFSLVTFLSFVLSLKARSQTDDYCYLVTGSGKYINLSSICKPSNKKRSKTKNLEQSELEKGLPQIHPPKSSHYGQPRKRYFNRE